MLRFGACLIVTILLTTADLGYAATQGIDMTKVLIDHQGQPIKDILVRAADDPNCDRCPPLTLGHAIEHALFGNYPDERDLSGEQKFARGTLAMRTKDDPQAQIAVEEISVIKRLMGKMYGPELIIQVFPLLDPNVVAEKIK